MSLEYILLTGIEMIEGYYLDQDFRGMQKNNEFSFKVECSCAQLLYGYKQMGLLLVKNNSLLA